MKANNMLLILLAIMIIFTGFYARSLYSAAATYCYAKCETTKSKCNGAALFKDGHIYDCSKSGSGCSGHCYTCSSGASDQFCMHTGNSKNQCIVATPGTPVVSCGTQKKHANGCGGTWSSGCSCDTSSSENTSTACEPNECVG